MNSAFTTGYCPRMTCCPPRCLAQPGAGEQRELERRTFRWQCGDFLAGGGRVILASIEEQPDFRHLDGGGVSGSRKLPAAMAGYGAQCRGNKFLSAGSLTGNGKSLLARPPRGLCGFPRGGLLHEIGWLNCLVYARRVRCRRECSRGMILCRAQS